MTKQEYTEYQASVAAFIATEEIKHLSTGTADLLAGESAEDSNGEPWFSWSPCECCKSHMGGSREYLHARDSKDTLVQFTICEDCVYYLEYGRLDDTTMAEVENV